MNWTVFLTDTIELSKLDLRRELGGKGAALADLIQAGSPVPPAFVVLSFAFDKFIKESDIKELLGKEMDKTNSGDYEKTVEVSKRIHDIIIGSEISANLEYEIYSAFDELESPYVAVRSSATAEDSSSASWAGELNTFLNVQRDDLILKIKECWASLFTPRAIMYRNNHNMRDSYIGLAVVVQKMVQSEIAGVSFTLHPVTKDPDHIIIEAGYGLGEAVVGGYIIPDSYIISKSKSSIIHIHIGKQRRKLVRNSNSQTNQENNIWVEVGEEGGLQKLSDDQIIMAAKHFAFIESYYGFPCDIEWTVEQDKLYITQSRPITTL